MLVKKYQHALAALAGGILGSPDEAGDVVQEAFLQAYTNLHRFDPERSFKTWLFAIAVNKSIDRIRKRKSFLNYFKIQTREANVAADSGFTPLEESYRFAPLLKKLNPRERVAICLKTNEDCSAKEIGLVLNCSEATARVHLYKARKKLAKALQAKGNKGGERSHDM